MADGDEQPHRRLTLCETPLHDGVAGRGACGPFAKSYAQAGIQRADLKKGC